MKVVFVSNMYPSIESPFKGTFVKNVLEGFKARGAVTELITIQSYQNLGLVFKLRAYFSFFVRSFFRTIFSRKSDVFYIHYTSHSSLGVILGYFLRLGLSVNVVTNVHGSDILPEDGRFSSIKIYISRVVLNISSTIVVPSGYFKSIVIKKFGISSSKVVISPSGGVDKNIFYPKNYNEKVYTFGYIGRLEDNKGIFELLEAYKITRINNPTISLLVVGSGSKSSEVISIAKRIGGVTVLPGQDQLGLSEQYNNIKFLIFPSKARESLGLVPIEAMMCGVPVISSRIESAKDYIKLDMKELLHNPGDISELSKVMQKALCICGNDYNELCLLALSLSSTFSSERVLNDLYDCFISSTTSDGEEYI